MTVYGQIPGVQIETTAVGVGDVTVGTESVLTLVGVGATDASASTNEPVRLESRSTVVDQFGEGSDVLVAYDQAIANGANPSYIYGIRASTSSSLATLDTSSGELSEIPISDKSRIDFNPDSADGTVQFSYETGDDIPVPSNSSTVHLNPATGAYELDGSGSSPELDYPVVDWDSAIRAASDTLDLGQFGVIVPLTENEQAGTTLQSVLTDMREVELKMAVGMIGAEPNTTVREEHPGFDTTDISTRFTDDTIFSIAGASLATRDPTQPGFGTGALGAVAGLFAGTPNTDPVYDTTLAGITELAQQFSRADIGALRDAYFIPLADSDSIRVADNQSTYDQDADGGWERDFFHRRVVDLTMITSYRIARRELGGVLDSDVVDDVQDAVTVELAELVNDGLLQPGQQNANAYREDSTTIGLDLTIAPFGVAKGADIELSIRQ